MEIDLKKSIGTFIFLALIIAVIALVQPVYHRLWVTLSAQEQRYADMIREKTGLSVSYKSLSPSILSSINMKGIVVTDASTGKKLLEVRRASISYRAGEGIKSVSANGVTAEFDAVKDADVRDKIANLIIQLQGGAKDDDKDSAGTNLEKFTKTILSVKNISLPFDVMLRNVSLHYSDSDNDILAVLKKASFSDSRKKDNIDTLISGTVTLKNRFIKIENRRAVSAFAFLFNGSIKSALDGSSARFQVSSVNSADYTFGKMDFLFNYTDAQFLFRTVRSVWPASLLLDANLKTGKAHLVASADHFNPFLLFKIKHQNNLISQLNGMSLSGSLSADSLFASKNGGKRSLSYKIDGSVDMPKKNGYPSVSVACRLDGNLQKVNFERLAVAGNQIGAVFSGSYNIVTKQPSGTLTIDHLVLSNGGVLSTEVYIEPQNNGFMCFSPQLYLGTQSFTALQLTVMPVRSSIDFSFEADDYSHAEYGKPGHIKIDGSYLPGKSQYFQAGIVISDLFMDSALKAVSFFLPEKQSKMLSGSADMLSPYICTDELYFSTDFNQLSFNAPYCVIANTKKDREVLVFAVDGSNQTIQLSRFDLIYGSQTAHASAQADFMPDTREAVFSGDFTVNSLPYRFNGTVSPDYIGVTGDYGLDAAVTFGNSPDSEINGTAKFSSLPFSIGSSVVTVTADTAFSYTNHDGFALNIMRLEAEEPTGKLSFRPKLTLSGTANSYGLVFDSIAYTDSVSVLNGQASLLWNYNNGLFDSAHAALNVSSPLTAEKFDFTGDLTNPTHEPLSFSSLMNDIYFSSELSVSSLPMSRFVADQSVDNTLTATGSVSGTLSNPFVSVTVQNVSVSALGAPLIAHGSFVMDDTGVSTNGFNCSWMQFSISDLNMLFHPETFSGTVQAVFDGAVAGQSIHAPFTVKLTSDENTNGAIPKVYTAVLTAPEVSGDLFHNPVPFSLTVNHSPGMFDIFSGTGTGISAVVLDNGTVSVRTGSSVPFVFNIDGTVTPSSLDLSVTNVYADLARLSSYVAIPNISFSGGEFKGACKIGGIPTDPEFTGAFTVTGFDLDAPDFLQDSLRADRILIAIGQSGLSIPDTMFRTGKGQVLFGMNVLFDRWKIDSTVIRLKTPEKSLIPIDLKVPFVHYKGDSSMNLNMTFYTDGMEFDGDVTAENGIFEFVTSQLQATLAGENLSASVPSSTLISTAEDYGRMSSIKVQLNMLVGEHVQVQFNPLLRGVVVPNTPVFFYYDNNSDSLLLKGDVVLRGGEVAWLNRNFYMKQGRITFNENQNNMDPRVTVVAETRERDDAGNQVRITLSALNQPLSKFNPQLSASPAKSELEIMELLGQIVTADSSNVSSFVMAGGDYLVQATVVRQIENALRELCNFDIFSVRTMVLQNALKQGLNLNSGSDQLTVGNFFDNSTVYIGKYFGSSIYADALMHWSYDKAKVNDSSTVGGLVFQPEFGLEMASPFATIRWGIAPDIEAIKKNRWVPSSSITLSWKYSF